jgi:hypothetical protein
MKWQEREINLVVATFVLMLVKDLVSINNH